MIHPTASIEPGVTLAQPWNDDTVQVDAYAIVGREARRGYTARDPGLPGLTTIGMGTLIGCHTVVYAGCTIGAHCLIGDGSSLYVNCQLGDRVRLGRNVTISYDVQIGDATIIMDGSHITGSAIIGQRCFIGPGVQMANDTEPRQRYDAARLAPPIIGNDVLIGVGAIICPGVTIGDGATIGAGAIVSEDVPAGATVAAARGRRVPVQICSTPLTQTLLDDARADGLPDGALLAAMMERSGIGDYTPMYQGAITSPELVVYAPMGQCARCGAALDNVAPGFSAVTGGQLVCANCLRPGEEILRARLVE